MNGLFPLLAAAVVVLLGAMLFWVRQRAARIRLEALEREERALEALSLLRDSRLAPPKIEQAVEVYDLDALLAEPTQAADSKLSELSELSGPLTLVEAPDTLGPFGATLSASPAATSFTSPAAALSASPAYAEVHHGGIEVETAGAHPEVAEALSATLHGDSAEESVTIEAPLPAAPAVPADAPELGAGVPLRELAIVWFEARGYQASPASQALRPIELVLRHRGDPARAYAFVEIATPLTAGGCRELVDQAHSIGLVRLLIVAEAGVDEGVARDLRRRGSRVMDRVAMQKALAKLEFKVAARIVAVARTRADSPVVR